VGGQLHVPAALPPGKRPGTHRIGGWVIYSELIQVKQGVRDELAKFRALILHIFMKCDSILCEF
jgi:hypothetical protein